MSMSVFAGKKVIEDGRELTVWAFPDSWAKEGEWVIDPEAEIGERLIKNPDYREDLDLNFSNQNAYLILELLNYKVEDGYWGAPIDEFIERAEKWLELNDTEKSYTQDLDGEIVFGIFNPPYAIGRIKKILHIAKCGKEFDATIIYAA